MSVTDLLLTGEHTEFSGTPSQNQAARWEASLLDSVDCLLPVCSHDLFVQEQGTGVYLLNALSLAPQGPTLMISFDLKVFPYCKDSCRVYVWEVG